MKKPKTAMFLCVGGPFDGKRIRLSLDFPVRSSVFSVPSYKNGEKGEYIWNAEIRDSVIWRPK